MEAISKLIWAVALLAASFFLIKYCSVNSERSFDRSRKKHDVKAGILPEIVAGYGFTYRKQGIYHFYTLRQCKINFDLFSYDNMKYKRHGENRYLIPYSTTYDYLSGIYKGIEMTGSSVRLNMPYEAAIPGYVYREDKPYEEWEDTACFFLLCGYMMRYKVNKRFAGTVTVYKKNIPMGVQYAEDKEKVLFGNPKLDELTDVYADRQESLSEISQELTEKLFDDGRIWAVSFTENYVTVLINVYKRDNSRYNFLKVNIDYFPTIKKEDKNDPAKIDLMRERFEYLLTIADYISGS